MTDAEQDYEATIKLYLAKKLLNVFQYTSDCKSQSTNCSACTMLLPINLPKKTFTLE